VRWAPSLSGFQREVKSKGELDQHHGREFGRFGGYIHIP
jgi:hypothetical protein